MEKKGQTNFHSVIGLGLGVTIRIDDYYNAKHKLNLRNTHFEFNLKRTQK